MIELLHDLGIEIKGKKDGQIKTICPQCSEGRKHKKDPCLSVNIDEGVYFCHHCDYSGTVKEIKSDKVYEKPTELGTSLDDKAKKFFTDRGISLETVQRFNITQSKKGIHFNYYYGPELMNIKFRGPGKTFQMSKGARKIFYNMNSIYGSDICYITEGEMDTLALYEAGIKKAISVPNGAHAKNNNLDYLDDIIADFDNLEKVVIMTDADAPGVALRNELARRFGKERCYFVHYPEGCKDANDILIKYGKEQLLKTANDIREFPVDGIATVGDFEKDVDYIFKHGYPTSLELGNELDDHIKWRSGEWTIITGAPGSGKSDVVDMIAITLAVKHGWKFGIFSPENKPYALHFWKIAQKLMGKMRKDFTENDLKQAKEFISKHFIWFDIDSPTIEDLLSKAKELVNRKGLNSFVFDPWNFIEHKYKTNETDYVSEALSKVTKFVSTNDVHIYIIAHPTKNRINPNKMSLYDIAGSANFFNKTYNGLIVSRNMETNETEISIDKVKFWFVGKAGKTVNWFWDIQKGTRYFDINYPARSEREILDMAYANDTAPF